MSNNDLKFTTAGDYMETEASNESLLIHSTDQDMDQVLDTVTEIVKQSIEQTEKIHLTRLKNIKHKGNSQ
jgi:nucleoid DNA-binding protein